MGWHAADADIVVATLDSEIQALCRQVPGPHRPFGQSRS
jgi:hypothetical protein